MPDTTTSVYSLHFFITHLRSNTTAFVLRFRRGGKCENFYLGSGETRHILVLGVHAAGYLIYSSTSWSC